MPACRATNLKGFPFIDDVKLVYSLQPDQIQLRLESILKRQCAVDIPRKNLLRKFSARECLVIRYRFRIPKGSITLTGNVIPSDSFRDMGIRYTSSFDLTPKVRQLSSYIIRTCFLPETLLELLIIIARRTKWYDANMYSQLRKIAWIWGMSNDHLSNWSSGAAKQSYYDRCCHFRMDPLWPG